MPCTQNYYILYSIVSYYILYITSDNDIILICVYNNFVTIIWPLIFSVIFKAKLY